MQRGKITGITTKLTTKKIHEPHRYHNKWFGPLASVFQTTQPPALSNHEDLEQSKFNASNRERVISAISIKLSVVSKNG